MARIDKGLVILVGRDRENPRTHREAFEITDGLGEMLDKHIKRNSLNKSEFIREAVAAKLEAEMPKEPLIKDEKIRKAVRAWAEAQGLTEVYLASNGYEVYGGVDDWVMQFKGEPFPFADKNRLYTIAELCGEEKE